MCLKLYSTICVVLVGSLLATGNAAACIVSFRDAEYLKREATLVIQAKGLSKEVNGQSQLGELYSYTVQLKSTERGIWRSKTPIVVSYYNLRARQRNGEIECPIKDGSGSETNLKIGETYRFYLKSVKTTDILFSEVVTKQP